ncbi:MAG: acetylglutamate kinase [Myxococcota bacterium]
MKIVVKLGGEILSKERIGEARAIAADLRALIAAGNRVVLVHGGGPQTTALQKRLGQEPRIVGGRRVTDDDALEAIKMIVGGKLNIDFCSILSGAGVAAVGLSGASAQAIAAHKRPPKVVSGGGDEPVDFGHVGDVTGVNHALLDLLLGGGFTPVLACIGADDAGRIYNINADAVANGVARAIGADRMVMITGAPGVLRDIDDPSSRIRALDKAGAEAAIREGTVAGGMIPKLEESFEALAAGVQGVHIVGRLQAGDLLKEIEQPGAVGTVLKP